MPLIKIDLFPGRSIETKNEIAEHITKLFETVAGVSPADTTVMFNEVEPQDWFVGGTSFAARRTKT